MARRGYLVLAHLACRTPLSVSFSSHKELPALTGLSSFLPCDHWHLSTALSIARTGQVIQFVQGHWSFAMRSYRSLLAQGVSAQTRGKSR